MAELVYKTWERLTGKPWSAARAGGYTSGTAAENLALQKRLLGGWNPYGGGTTATATSGGGQAGLPTWAPKQIDVQSQLGEAKTAASALPGQISEFLAGQKAETDLWQQGFQEAIPGLLEGAREQYGVGAAQQKFGEMSDLATALSNRIVELQTNAPGTGAGGYASAGQVDRAIQTGYLPRSQMATAQAQTAGTQLQTAQQLAQGEFAARLKPYEYEAAMMSDRMAREATGYTQAMQSRLDTLLQIPQLSLAQQQELNQLAMAEQQNEIAREQISAQIRAAEISASAQNRASDSSNALAQALAEAAAGGGGGGVDIAAFQSDLNRVGAGGGGGISLTQLMEKYAGTMDYNTILQSYAALRPSWDIRETDAQLQAAYQRGRGQ